MTEKLKQIMKEELLKLPKQNQDAINSFDWGNKVEEIGKKFLLRDSEINDLQTETGLVLLGLIDLDLYKFNIEVEIGTSVNDAEKITNEIFEKVFTPIAEKIESETKNNLSLKNIPWNQTINFIVSGGDYSSFI